MNTTVDWLEVVQQLRRIAQAGLAYSEGPYDRERYSQLTRLAAEIAAAHLDASADRVEEILRAELGYPTPKIDVRAVVPREGKLLFVKEAADGRWALPGGWADIGESASEVTAREVLEETGYIVEPERLVALLDKSKHGHPRDLWWTYKVFFVCRLTGGEPRPSHETVEVAFFGPDDLPSLSLERNTEEQVRRMFVHAANPALPADYD
jgi:ADP-ribose pyrophosphatase YjhB (NUDIX family)